ARAGARQAVRVSDPVVLTRAAYEALIARVTAAEDAADFARHAQIPKERMLPIAAAGRILNGEHPLRVWREHRGLGIAELAGAAGVTRGQLGRIERRASAGSVAAYRACAWVLDVLVDDLLPD